MLLQTLLVVLLGQDDAQLDGPRHRYELGVGVGGSLNTRLTEHTIFSALVARDFAETFAGELRVGYALSSHSALADQQADRVFVQSTTAVPQATDFADLWELKGFGLLSLRWAPVHAEASILDELVFVVRPYLALGAGVAQFAQESMVVCNARGVATAGTPARPCAAYLRRERAHAVFSGAVGLLAFLHLRHALRLEVRDWAWLDDYLADVDRAAALNPATRTGGGTPVYGLTQVVQLDVGYTFFF